MNTDTLIPSQTPDTPSSPVSRFRSGLIFPVLILALAGCDSTSTGFCEHINEDPVLTITTATNAVTGDPIPTLRLKDLVVAADEEFDEIFTMTQPPSYSIVREGTDYICQVACGFGAAVGRYNFSVVAEGFQAKSVSVVADYDRFVPGCPSRSRGSTELTVQLEPVTE
jgi:hypothetical protein